MDYITLLINQHPELNSIKEEILNAKDLLIQCFSSGNKLLIAGNGGSSSDSSHIAGELLKSFCKKRIVPSTLFEKISKIDSESSEYLKNKLQGSLPVISLCDNIASLTASANDIDGNIIFAQSLYGLAKEGDIFLGITTSGNSKNVIYACALAKALGLKTIALTGKDGGKIKSIADISIIVPESETYKIQELHLPIYHALCLEVEEYFWSE